MRSKTLLALTTFLLLMVPQALLAQSTGAEMPGAEKLDAELLSLLDNNRSQKMHRVIVSLAPLSTAAERAVAFTSADGEQRLQASITRAQDSVLRAQRRGDLQVLNRYQTVYGFSMLASEEAILDLAAMDGVERLELMPMHYKMDAEAHPITNVDDVHSAGTTGAGVTIAIIDDGIDHDHAAFGGSSAWPNSKILGGRDFADNDSNPRIDCTNQSHGTAVAGVAAGNGGGVVGSAKDAKVVFLKIQSASICGQNGLDGDIVGAIDWAVANRNAFSPAIKIISMSLGGGLYTGNCDSSSSSYANAINNAVSAGITVLAASGNDGSANRMSRPACMSGAISVGATYDANIGGANFGLCNDTTTAADKVTCYSNSNSSLDILAPSHCARTAQAGGGQNTCFGGTSSATPYAAGVTALLYETNSSLTPAAARSTLSSTGVSITDSKNGISKPRVNAQAAVAAVGGGGGGGGGAPCTGCDQYSGSLSGTGDSDVQPNGTYYYSSSSGSHHGWLEGPGSADFDLELYRWTGSWTKVAQSISSTSSEEVNYNGPAGYYYWRIRSYSGSGSYDFWLDRP